MSKSLKQEPKVKLTQEQFDELMQRYSQLKSTVATYDGGYSVVVDAKTEHELLKEYGIDTEYEPDANGNYPEHRFETAGLREIEQLTGYNTFPYSKTAYMYATDKAITRTKNSKNSHMDSIEALKDELKLSEKYWHEDTGVNFDEIKGKNVHKDDEHLNNMQLNQKRQSAIDFLGQISQYSGNQYIKMLYDFAVQYNDELYKRNQQQFSEKKELTKVVEKSQEQSNDKVDSSVIVMRQTDGKDPAFASYGKKDEPELGVKRGRNGKFYGYDMSNGPQTQESGLQPRSYGGEVDKYMRETNGTTAPVVQSGMEL